MSLISISVPFLSYLFNISLKEVPKNIIAIKKYNTSLYIKEQLINLKSEEKKILPAYVLQVKEKIYMQNNL